MRYFLVMNPLSHSGKSQKQFQKIFDGLKSRNILYDFAETSDPHIACTHSHTASQKGYDAVVAVGGDGTINSVLNGFFDRNGKRISTTKFGIMYTGTSPDFCKSYNIPLRMDGALQTLLNGHSRKIQVGRIQLLKRLNPALDVLTLEEAQLQNPGSDIHYTTQYFGCCANFGLGAQVAREANSGARKVLGDFLGTFSAILHTLASYKPSDMAVYIDGKKETVEKAFNISIGRTYYIASGIKVKNDLHDNDGKLYQLTIQKLGAQNILPIIKTIYQGKGFSNNESLHLTYGRVFDIAGNNQNPEIEFDGDPAGFLPCRIDVAHDPLDLICEVAHEQ